MVRSVRRGTKPAVRAVRGGVNNAPERAVRAAQCCVCCGCRRWLRVVVYDSEADRDSATQAGRGGGGRQGRGAAGRPVLFLARPRRPAIIAVAPRRTVGPCLIEALPDPTSNHHSSGLLDFEHLGLIASPHLSTRGLQQSQGQ